MFNHAISKAALLSRPFMEGAVGERVRKLSIG